MIKGIRGTRQIFPSSSNLLGPRQQIYVLDRLHRTLQHLKQVRQVREPALLEELSPGALERTAGRIEGLVRGIRVQEPSLRLLVLGFVGEVDVRDAAADVDSEALDPLEAEAVVVAEVVETLSAQLQEAVHVGDVDRRSVGVVHDGGAIGREVLMVRQCLVSSFAVHLEPTVGGRMAGRVERNDVLGPIALPTFLAAMCWTVSAAVVEVVHVHADFNGVGNSILLVVVSENLVSQLDGKAGKHRELVVGWCSKGTGTGVRGDCVLVRRDRGLVCVRDRGAGLGGVLGGES